MLSFPFDFYLFFLVLLLIHIATLFILFFFSRLSNFSLMSFFLFLLIIFFSFFLPLSFLLCANKKTLSFSPSNPQNRNQKSAQKNRKNLSKISPKKNDKKRPLFFPVNTYQKISVISFCVYAFSSFILVLFQ